MPSGADNATPRIACAIVASSPSDTCDQANGAGGPPARGNGESLGQSFPAIVQRKERFAEIAAAGGKTRGDQLGRQVRVVAGH